MPTAPTIPATSVSRLNRAAGLARMRGAQPLRIDNPSIVRTDRLTLRPVTPSDREEFLRVLRISRAHLTRFCPLGKGGIGDESAEELFDRQLQLSEGALATGKAWRRIGVTSDGRIAGSFCINDISRGLENSGELVFWMSAELAGQGYATEGVRATLEHAFADLPRGLGLHRVVALVAPSNAACLRVMRKTGFALNPQGVPIELILSGKPAPHDVYAAFAPLAERLRNVGGDQRRLQKSLTEILCTEAAAHVNAPQ